MILRELWLTTVNTCHSSNELSLNCKHYIQEIKVDFRVFQCSLTRSSSIKPCPLDLQKNLTVPSWTSSPIRPFMDWVLVRRVMMISGSLRPSGIGEIPFGDKDLSASRDDMMSLSTISKFKMKLRSYLNFLIFLCSSNNIQAAFSLGFRNTPDFLSKRQNSTTFVMFCSNDHDPVACNRNLSRTECYFLRHCK